MPWLDRGVKMLPNVASSCRRASNIGTGMTVETLAMTRRSAILVLTTAPAWAFATKEFWNEKQPGEWTEEEIRELLTNSPWARPATVNYNAGPGNVGRPAASGGGYGGRRASRAPVVTGPGDTPMGKQQYQAVVRWESAQPVRAASHSQSTDDPLANYVINVIGDLPMLGTHKDEDLAQRQQRSDMLKDFTRLERKNDPIYLSKVIFKSPTETLFYFPRLDTIFPDDKQVTFVTKLGPLAVRARFTLKEMVYRGKLEL